MVSYDPVVIRTFAQTLYDRAATVMFISTAIGVVIGGIAGKFVFENFGMLVLAAFSGGIGYWMGSQRASVMKLQAQTALCQVQIEQNTRARSGQNVPIGQPAAQALAEPDAPMGTCPNCSTVIPITAQNCPKCKALFGPESDWKITSR